VSALKASDQVLRYSIDKSTVELLYLPLSAAETFRVKAFIDTVVYRFGDGLGGLAVLVFAAGFGWSPVQVGWVTLAVVAAWLVAAATARQQYVTNLRESILQHRMDAERAHGALLDPQCRRCAGAQSSKGARPTSSMRSASSKWRGRTAVHQAIPGCCAASRRRCACARWRCSHRPTCARWCRRCEALCDPQLECARGAAVSTHTTAVDPLTIIERVGDFEGSRFRQRWWRSSRPGRAPNQAAQSSCSGWWPTAPTTACVATFRRPASSASRPTSSSAKLRKLLEDDAPEVARRPSARPAASANAARAPPRGRIAEPWLDDVVATLGQLGDRIVGTLRDYSSMGTRRRPSAASCRRAQAIATPAAAAVLVEVCSTRHRRALRVVTPSTSCCSSIQLDVDRGIVETALAAEITGHYRSYQVLGTMGGSLAGAEPVLAALRESLSQESERIFRLMKVLYPDHDLHSAFVGVQSADRSVHDNALEFLENVLPPPVRVLVVPLLDREVSTDERARLAERLVGVTLGSREEAVEVLALSRDPWLQSCAAYAIGELRLAHFAGTVDRWANDADPLLRATARAACEKLKAHAASASVDVG
jgi:hypothetical protein